MRRRLHGRCAAAVVSTALVCASPARAQISRGPEGAPTKVAQSATAETAPEVAPKLSPTTGITQAPAAPASPLNPEGGNLFGVFFGYGFNQSIYSSARGIDIASAGVRWTHLWAVRGGGIFRGQRGLGIELVPVTNFIESERSTWGLGANLLYEYHFAAPGRVLPIWRIGAGLVYSTRPIPRNETKQNFSVITDLGADITVTDSSAMYLGYRFHHGSNAGTGNVNPGINVRSVIFGLSFYR
jgi:hypothetical protein